MLKFLYVRKLAIFFTVTVDVPKISKWVSYNRELYSSYIHGNIRFTMNTHSTYEESDDDSDTKKCVNCRNVVDVKHFKAGYDKCLLCIRVGGIPHRDLKDLYYNALSTNKDLKSTCKNLSTGIRFHQRANSAISDENETLRSEISDLHELLTELNELRIRDKARITANKTKKLKQRKSAKHKRMEDLPCGPIL